jgi:hypothetical protein
VLCHDLNCEARRTGKTTILEDPYEHCVVRTKKVNGKSEYLPVRDWCDACENKRQEEREARRQRSAIGFPLP